VGHVPLVVKGDELCRCAAGGVLASLFTALSIALPPILAVGSDYLKDKVARACITGEKVIALAITEPWAGSDVAGIRTTAHREGDVYVVNGLKKFITAGMYADYFTTAVRTGGDGMGGISLLLIERTMPGIHCTRLATTGWLSSATTLVRFENVRVPVANLIGEENNGFMAIMLNFNQERMGGVHRGGALLARSTDRGGQVRAPAHDVWQAADRQRPDSRQARRHGAPGRGDAGADRRARLADRERHRCARARTEDRARESAGHAPDGVLRARGGADLWRQLVSAQRARCDVERIGREVRVMAVGGGSEEVMLDFAVRASKL
jgi:acyl-CoA dehydrogenase